jgi:outer membrane protein OmpA-like peptidoglycan-associated protein
MRNFFSLLLSILSTVPAFSQSEPVTVKVTIVSQITNKPIDATLDWYNSESIKHEGLGNYAVVLDGDREETLTISKPGYFDTEVKLDYETVKASPLQEVKLQSGIPQLHISVVDSQTKKQIDAGIDLFTLDESTEIFSEQVQVAPYTIDLEYDQVHVLQVRAPGYFSFKDTIDFKGVFDGRVRAKEISLVPLKAGNKISLSNIYFQQNEAALTDFARLMLVELTHVLEQQKNLVIEIGAFTDDIGSNDYNLELSKKRAQAVKLYLVEKGAAPEQLQTKGYGEATPIVPNTNEANRALNRRVEFKIINIK